MAPASGMVGAACVDAFRNDGWVARACREDDMSYEFTAQGRVMHDEVAGFMADHIYPNEVADHQELE